MILVYTGSKHLRSALRSAEKRTGPSLSFLDPLPDRITDAIALAAASIARSEADGVIAIEESSPEAADAMIDSLIVLGEQSLPGNHLPGIELQASTEVNVDPDARLGREAQSKTQVGLAAVVASAVAILGPDRVAAVRIAPEPISRLEEMISAFQNGLTRAERSRAGGPHVREAIVMARDVAEQLRLTQTQRARLASATRSAAIRGGSIPAPLRTRYSEASTKHDRNIAFATLADALERWRVPE